MSDEETPYDEETEEADRDMLAYYNQVRVQNLHVNDVMAREHAVAFQMRLCRRYAMFFDFFLT